MSRGREHLVDLEPFGEQIYLVTRDERGGDGKIREHLLELEQGEQLSRRVTKSGRLFYPQRSQRITFFRLYYK